MTYRNRYNEALEDPYTQGIFYYLQSEDVPWADKNINEELDAYYAGTHSGEKYVNNFMQMVMNHSDDGKVTPATMQLMASQCVALFGESWNRIWNTFNLEYDPIENYNVVEEYEGDREDTYGKTRTRTDNLTNQRTDNLTDQRTNNLTDTRTDNLSHGKTGTVGETGTNTGQNTDKIAGFNSSNPVTSDQTDTTGSTSNTTTHNTTETDTGTQTIASTGTQSDTHTGTQTETQTGTQTDADSGSDSMEEGHTLLKHGNIGVTSSQQLVKSERELWWWSFFIQIVCPDVDKILTLPIY